MVELDGAQARQLTARLLLVAAALLWPAIALAQGWSGLPLAEALERLRAGGLALVYSSDLVRPGMRVGAEPQASEPRALLAEILAPHELMARPGPGGLLMLVRATRETDRATVLQRRPPPTPLDEVVVSASHYRLGGEVPPGAARFLAADLELLPEIGEDPLRAVARLPGIAGQDFSSRTHLRGGAADETLVRFDDLRLYNPFHLKDFLGIFSAVDPGIVRDISVYTGGFPVSYGDRTSGVIDIKPALPADGLHGQLAISLFNTSAMLGSDFDGGDGEWLVSARRSNLDWYLDQADPALGKPGYHDFYGRLGHRLGDRWSLSANLLLFSDQLRLFDNDREEEASAEYRDEYYWLRLDYGDDQGTGGRLLAAHTHLAAERVGSAELPGVGSGMLEDLRDASIQSLQADGWWRPRAGSLLQAGVDLRRLSAEYRFRDEVQLELLFDTPGAAQLRSRARNISLSPAGNQFGAYLNWRWEPGSRLTTDLGLRWDRDTLGPGDHHLSPRVVLLWAQDDATRLRLSWGRFVQAQGVSELAVPDGELAFNRAQRADHLVASLERRLNARFNLRLEAYRKDYGQLIPRYENLLNTLVVLPELKPDRIRIAPQAARADGAELTMNYQDGPLSGWLSYSWSRVVDRVDGETLHRSWDQRHYLSGGIGYRGPKWELSAAATWRSGWPTTAIELETLLPEPRVAVGRRNALLQRSHARLDARVARRWQLGSGNELLVFGEVHNLLKRGNQCCVEYQIETEEGPPFLDVAPVRSVSLIPSVGFVWKF